MDQFVRLIQKRGAGVPTIPPSTDHRNGDWLDTDIYEGETYQDTDTGLTYTRKGSDIVMLSGEKAQLRYKALITQTGTNAPVLTEIENSLGVTVTSNYLGVGGYTLSGFSGLLTGDIEISLLKNTVAGEYAVSTLVSSSVLSIETGDYATDTTAFTPKDGVLDTLGNSITIIKY